MPSSRLSNLRALREARDSTVAVHTKGMDHATRPDKLLHIPLSEREAVSLLGRVKPTADMPRQGAHPTKAKRKQESRAKRAK